MLKFDRIEFPLLDHTGCGPGWVSGAWQANPSWLKQHSTR